MKNLVKNISITLVLVIALFVNVGSQSYYKIEETATTIVTVYTYTGAPITFTSTKILLEYTTFTETIIITTVVAITVEKPIYKTLTQTLITATTITIHAYIQLEEYLTILALLFAIIILLLLLLFRGRRLRET
ncbi:MAG: hypothetical protein QW382_01680 [Nitrososphaerota archaeon]